MEVTLTRNLRYATTFAAVAFALSSIVGVPAAVAQEAFSLPSRNIWCYCDDLAPRGPVLTCYRSKPKFLAITLGPSGKPEVSRPADDAGDDDDDDPIEAYVSTYDVLEYGQRWSRGRLSCSSSEAGLSCERDDPRHGFFLSRDHVKTY